LLTAVDTAAAIVVSRAGGMLLTETARTVSLDGALSAWNVPDFIDTGLGCQFGEFPES